MENAQAVLKALNAPGDTGERITAIGRQLGYFGYLSLDNIAWVRVSGLYARICLTLDRPGQCYQVLQPGAVHGTED